MRTFRKIPCILAVALIGLGSLMAAPAGARERHDHAGKHPRKPSLLKADLSQAGRRLIATLRTSKPVPLGRLDRLPRPRVAGSAYLCFELRRADRHGERRLCLGGRQGAHRRVGLELVNAKGRTTAKRTLAARVTRPEPRKLVLSLLPGGAGLQPHRYEWRVLERSRRDERLPAKGSRRFRLRPVRAVGCTGGHAGWVTNGPRDRNVVALTFDDGPAEDTAAFLDLLREKHANGTFFEIGQEMPGREDTMRRILEEGSEIGDHTMHHVAFPGYEEIAEPSRLIEEYTHFKPCLFRPPDGGVDSAVISNAAALGMLTVTWDVDPSDWTNPGSGAVYSRVVEAVQPGSIVLMHDGPERAGTLAALPAIIDALRGRGYRFATVSELLGNRLLYRPYG